jgi:hypothetical protein
MRRSGPPKAKRKKKCKVCRKEFSPFTSTQVVCGPTCSLALVRQRSEKRARAKLRADKLRIKPKAKWMAEAQTAFNAFIRLRDNDLPCISCGVINPPTRHGGAWDCGHYLTRGAHPELRFNEDNAHKQCKRCNGGAGRFSGKGHTVQQAYRVNLVGKIGLAAVTWLEGPQEPERYRIEDLREIKAKYQQKRRDLIRAFEKVPAGQPQRL